LSRDMLVSGGAFHRATHLAGAGNFLSFASTPAPSSHDGYFRSRLPLPAPGRAEARSAARAGPVLENERCTSLFSPKPSQDCGFPNPSRPNLGTLNKNSEWFGSRRQASWLAGLFRPGSTHATRPIGGPGLALFVNAEGLGWGCGTPPSQSLGRSRRFGNHHGRPAASGGGGISISSNR